MKTRSLLLSIILALVLTVQADTEIELPATMAIQQATSPSSDADPVRFDLIGSDLSAFSLSYDAQGTVPGIARFSNSSTLGEFRWEIAADGQSDRVQMSLDSQNVLKLFKQPPPNVTPVGEPIAGIVLNPNTATISLNGSNVLTQASLSSGLALSGLSVLNGYVGIGTSTPEQMLDVQGQIRLRDMIRVEVTSVLAAEAGYYADYYHDSNDAYFRAYCVASAAGYPRYLDIVAGGGNQWSVMRFLTQSYGQWQIAERMRIDAVGNVGVGTAAPTAKLHVAGDVKVNGVLRTDRAAGDISMGQFTSPAP